MELRKGTGARACAGYLRNPVNLVNPVQKNPPAFPFRKFGKNSVNSVKNSVAAYCRPQDKSEGRPGFPKRPSLFRA